MKRKMATTRFNIETPHKSSASLDASRSLCRTRLTKEFDEYRDEVLLAISSDIVSVEIMAAAIPQYKLIARPSLSFKS
jgi:hypothetical protein